MFKWVGIVALCLLVPASAHAQKKGTLSPADYEEIRGLYARYCYGFDTGNAQMVAGVYAADGAFVVGGKVVGDSREKIAAGVKPRTPGSPAMKHMPTNIMIEPSEDGAKGMSYVALVTFADGKAPVIIGGGTYNDLLVKTADGWRFKRRDYQPFSTPPAPTSTP